MTRDVRIQESGTNQDFEDVKTLTTPVVGGGNATWMPEDETAVGEITITSNGEFVPSEHNLYGFYKVNVMVPGGGQGEYVSPGGIGVNIDGTIPMTQPDGTISNVRIGDGLYTPPPAGMGGTIDGVSVSGGTIAGIDPDTGDYVQYTVVDSNGVPTLSKTTPQDWYHDILTDEQVPQQYSQVREDVIDDIINQPLIASYMLVCITRYTSATIYTKSVYSGSNCIFTSIRATNGSPIDIIAASDTQGAQYTVNYYNKSYTSQGSDDDKLEGEYVQSGNAQTVTLNSEYTRNGKTVYYSDSGTYYKQKYFLVPENIDKDRSAHSYAGYLNSDGISRVAWSMVYGEVTDVEVNDGRYSSISGGGGGHSF